MKRTTKLALLILLLSTLVCCQNFFLKKHKTMKPTIKLPEDAPALLGTVNGRTAINNVLDSMSKTGMAKELVDAMKKHKDDDFFKLTILEYLSPLNY